MIRPLLMLAALTLAACASTASSTKDESTGPAAQPDTETVVTGTVVYRERVALTPAAVVQIEVVELTPEGTPGPVIGEQTIQSPSQVPIHFSVAISPQRLRPGASYAVRARITDGGRVFSSAAPVPVLTPDNRGSGVQVLVRSGG